METRHISSHVADCGRAFLSLVEALELSPRFATQMRPEKVKEEFDRFKIWAGNVAAHRKGRRSLEYRLRDATHLKDETHNLLAALQSSLKDALSIVKEERIPWDELSDSDTNSESGDESTELQNRALQGDTELKQIHAGLRDAVTCLFRLSMAIRDPAPNSQSGSIITADKSYFEDFDIQHVKAKFPACEDHLSERLGAAISARRQYLSYREEHHRRLTKGVERLGFEEPKTEHTTHSTEATPMPITDSVVDERDKNSDVMDDGNDTLSQTSYATSVNATLRIPSLPKEAETNELYECPLCFMVVSIHTKEAWKKHVYRDLHPYCCTFKHCTTADRLYDSRHAWFKHEMEVHRAVWQCVDGCEKVFSSEPDFEAHIRRSHAELATQEAVSILTRTSTRSVNQTECAKCAICAMTMTMRALQRHLGRHQQQLALFALPSNIDATEDDDDNDKTSIRSVDAQGEEAIAADIGSSSSSSGEYETSLNDTLEDVAQPIQDRRSMPNPDKLRTWKDITGEFKVDAELLGVKADGKIKLHTTNGIKIAVPYYKMSPEDILVLIVHRTTTPDPDTEEAYISSKGDEEYVIDGDGNFLLDESGHRVNYEDHRLHQTGFDGPNLESSQLSKNQIISTSQIDSGLVAQVTANVKRQVLNDMGLSEGGLGVGASTVLSPPQANNLVDHAGIASEVDPEMIAQITAQVLESLKSSKAVNASASSPIEPQYPTRSPIASTRASFVFPSSPSFHDFDTQRKFPEATRVEVDDGKDDHPFNTSHESDIPFEHNRNLESRSETHISTAEPHSTLSDRKGPYLDRYFYPPVNSADQNPPCNTLYVGNVPLDTSEEELKSLFSRQSGYKRLLFRTKQNGFMAFVEFVDVQCATKALNELYGYSLHNCVGPGIRLSFSKNPLGVRAVPQPPRRPEPTPLRQGDAGDLSSPNFSYIRKARDDAPTVISEVSEAQLRESTIRSPSPNTLGLAN